MINNKEQQRGQVVLILLLVMTVALAIGLSVVQRSLSDLSSSTKIEQSTRAFSAAEAGIEKALQQNDGVNTNQEIPLENNSTATVVDSGLLPNQKQAIEYPPVSKEEIVHVWLADPDADFQTQSGQYYNQPTLEVYWGDTGPRKEEDQPALELNIISLTGGATRTYTTKKILLDPVLNRENNFLKKRQTNADVSRFECPTTTIFIKTIFSDVNSQSDDRPFYCQATLSNLPPILILLRARILYSNSSHPIAIKPTGNCPDSDLIPCSLPRQVKIIQSYGSSGDTQRAIQLFKVEKVVPFYFDYSIFSAGEISK